MTDDLPDPGPPVEPRLTRPLGTEEEVYRALVCATRDYVTKNGFDLVHIGLSGGIDSSLVAAVAADALGRERVVGVAMPSSFSSEHSLTDAEALARNLGIRLLTLPIAEPAEALLGVLKEPFAGTEPGLAEENLQARVRGTLLMSLSNKAGSLVLTTGNKSELAVGYCTLYGDMAGGFAVIRDVPKTLVYALARWRNGAGVVIPQSVLDKPPSAELRPGQLDTDSLPPYEVLDPILEAYVEDDASVDELVAKGFDRDTVAEVVRLVDGAEYKRRQAPPGPKVTGRSFGKDRRLPITNRFRGHDPSGEVEPGPRGYTWRVQETRGAGSEELFEEAAMPVTPADLAVWKQRRERFVMLTAYDALTARVLDEAGIPLLLVGDSVGNNVLGYDTTIPVTMEEALVFTAAVARGARNALVVADLPFGAYQASAARPWPTPPGWSRRAPTPSSWRAGAARPRRSGG